MGCDVMVDREIALPTTAVETRLIAPLRFEHVNDKWWYVKTLGPACNR